MYELLSGITEYFLTSYPNCPCNCEKSIVFFTIILLVLPNKHELFIPKRNLWKKFLPWTGANLLWKFR